MTEPKRAPRIALMGEFSAGKSTLCNLLMNGRRLPEKVTATQLPPVWITQGPGQHMRVDLDGNETPVSLDDLASVPVQSTLYVRIYLEEETLEHCDFIDFPGISDPNMEPEVWTRLLDEVDAVIWLTHATQAWRQSEAAAWDYVPDAVRARSLLLLTRWDKVTNEIDRARVLGRVKKETAGLFGAVLPISLVEAVAARDDYDAWSASGAVALMDHVVQMMTDLSAPEPRPEPADGGAQSASIAVSRFGSAADSPAPPAAESPALANPEPKTQRPKLRPIGPSQAAPDPEAPEAPDAGRVLPRRVRLAGPPRRSRPGRALAM